MFEFIAFDVETTGRRSAKDKVIEVGAERFVKGKPVESFSSFVRIDIPIPREATQVHGITDDMLVGQPDIGEVLEKFAEFCGDSVLLAHNARFDVSFITVAGEEVGVALPGGLVLDSYPLSKRAFTDFFSHSLANLTRKLEVPIENHHRAHDDSKACGIVFMKILRKLKESEGGLSLKKLVEWGGGELRFPVIEPRARQMGFL